MEPADQTFISQYGPALGVGLLIVSNLIFLLRELVPQWFQVWSRARSDEQEHRQQQETEAQQHRQELELKEKLEGLNSQAYTSQMLTQSLSEAQYENHQSNEWIRTEMARRQSATTEAIDRYHNQTRDTLERILQALVDLNHTMEELRDQNRD